MTFSIVARRARPASPWPASSSPWVARPCPRRAAQTVGAVATQAFAKVSYRTDVLTARAGVDPVERRRARSPRPTRAGRPAARRRRRGRSGHLHRPRLLRLGRRPRREPRRRRTLRRPGQHPRRGAGRHRDGGRLPDHRGAAPRTSAARRPARRRRGGWGRARSAVGRPRRRRPGGGYDGSGGRRPARRRPPRRPTALVRLLDLNDLYFGGPPTCSPRPALAAEVTAAPGRPRAHGRRSTRPSPRGRASRTTSCGWSPTASTRKVLAALRSATATPDHSRKDCQPAACRA